MLIRFPHVPRKIKVIAGGVFLALICAAALGVLYEDQGNNTSSTVRSYIPNLLASPIASSTQQATSTASSTKSKTAASSTAAKPLPVSEATVSAREVTAAGADLLHSIVNIVCLSSDPSIPSVSGSGVIIDSRGIILTAAHVAQLFLLQDYLGSDKVACLIRTGSPARRAYLAEPIYISSSWLQANPNTLSISNPKGSGEADFALLAITATATSTPLPASYPAIPLASSDPTASEPVAIGSYGAQYLTSSQLNYALYPILVFGTIQNRYTYGSNTVDLFSIQGSAASQEGSSGGGVVDANGHLIGTITTSSISGDISSRTLNAITASHLRRTYSLDTGSNLDSTLQNQSLTSLIASFKDQAYSMGRTLFANIQASKH